MAKLVYRFTRGSSDVGGPDGRNDKVLLGGKGAGLQEMCALGIPVPPGFTITTQVCRYFGQHGSYPDELREQVEQALRAVEASVGEGIRFGDPNNPLLLSVRSGAPVSMPGMMDTVLNLGLNDETVQGLIRRTRDRRFAFDSYRRFVQMYADVVLGLKAAEEEEDLFDGLLAKKRDERGVETDAQLLAEDLEDLVVQFKAVVLEHTGQPFPQDPIQQLWGAIAAVFRSWDNPRAITYRKMYSIPADWGTAVTVQAMVFGNLGDDCATGVAFTRNPSMGERRFYGEFLQNAQGEDVVAGIRTPRPIAELGDLMPAAHAQLVDVATRLERHFRDMQDIEFTIQQGHLWMLQTRTGKRAGRAMVKIAVDMVKEGLIDQREAVLRVDPTKLDELLHPMLDPNAERELLCTGLPASPGAATGKVVFTAREAEEMAQQGERVILVRTETSPEDIHGMQAAQGILTSRGGMTSHAAVVARGMGKCCVAGAQAMHVDYAAGQFTAGGTVVKRGDLITLDGSTGEVLLGAVPMIAAHLASNTDYQELMTWVDQGRRLRVRANADTPQDARSARSFGAEGIGLCRTEHMFFDPERILAVRQMILAGTTEGRRQALERILPMQRGDFEAIFTEMNGLPVTIRLLDPPLHEFLPTTEKDMRDVAQALDVTLEKVQRYTELLHEHNPMLGHRGCRLGVTYPEIYEVQVQAILEAAQAVQKQGIDVRPEIMIPLIGHSQELLRLRELVLRVAQTVGGDVKFTVGTMIELPRACMAADQIAQHADFFSFGTNDLTQTALGLSRDDAGRFLPRYVELGIYDNDPFVSIDIPGVGALMDLAVRKGRGQKAALKVGICGEHGGEPKSVEFCHRLGLDYVSCSPFRVPIARLAAAQAALREQASQAPKAPTGE